MAHKVKCLYCEEMFDRDKEPCQKIGRRYAHIACFQKNHKPDDDFKPKIFELVKEQYQEFNFAAIERQRASYIKKGMTNEGIYNSLYYYYVVKKNSTVLAKGRIGIVPYVYEEANDYFSQIKKNTERAMQATLPMKEYSVELPKENRVPSQGNRKIDLSRLE